MSRRLGPLAVASACLAFMGGPVAAGPDSPAGERRSRAEPSGRQPRRSREAACDTAELRAVDASAVLLRPSSFRSWPAMFAAHPDAVDYVLEPGDYSAWGPLVLEGRHGAKARKRTIRRRAGDPRRARRGRDPGLRPARIDALVVRGARHWLIHGLTIRAPSTANQIGGGAEDIALDGMLIENARAYGLRIRSSRDVCVQESVIRRAPRIARTDSVGIQIKPAGSPVAGVRIVGNRIYDFVDSIQITADGGDPWRAVERTYIADNDLYTTADYAGCTENGIDIKAGSSTSRTRIIGNRIWGFMGANTSCAGSGGRGDAIVIHFAGRNIEIAENTISRSKNGIREKYWPAGWPQDVSRKIAIRKNTLSRVESAFDLTHDTAVIGNTVTESDHVCDRGGDSGYRLGGPVFRDNVRRVVRGVSPPGDARACPYREGDNRVDETGPPARRHRDKGGKGGE